MSKFTKLSSKVLTVMLISILVLGQSLQADEAPNLQKTQDQLTQDVQPGVAPVTLLESDFDYTKIVTSDKSKDLLWDNGGLVTLPGAGSNGSDYSELQDASLGMTGYGAGFQVSAGNSVADEFIVDGSWTIESFTFYGYQTGSGPPSTLNDVRFQIWDDSPMAGGTVIFGDLTTNVMLSTTWSNIWRVLESGPTENRPIMEIVADASGLVLSDGTYWVEWQVGGTGTSGPWAPPVTIVGQATTGNALQHTSTGWAAYSDGGTLAPQGFPFLIDGSTGPQAEDDLGITQLISPVSGFELGVEAVTVKITNFGSNDQSGFDVSFTLDGGSAVTETVSATVMANSTYDYTFTATADLSAFGEYMIDACTMLAGDENTSNDCISETVTNSDPNPPGDCENFDALTVGGYVAGQLGGLWTTWSGSPGTAEDAIVSDMYSVSASNSFLVEGTTDLLQLFNATNITSGIYTYSNNIYVPTGTTGYWNLQKDVIPGITEGWGIQMMYDDDGMIHIDAGADDAAVVPFSYDTWYFNEVIVDLDNDMCEFYIDGTLITQHQWTLGTFGNVGPNTLGGCNYYANPGAGGALPGAHFDDVCFTGDIPEPPAPPTNLTGPDMVTAGNDIELNWMAPGGGEGFFEDFEGASFPPEGWIKMSPDGGTGWEPIQVGTTPIPGWTGGTISACPDGGDWQAFCTWTTGGVSSNDQWIVTPMVTVQSGDMLDFWLGNYFADQYADHFEVLISTTVQNDPNAFDIVVDEFDLNSADAWTQYSYDLTSFVSAGTPVYIAFREMVADNLNEGAAISIDNVMVGQSDGFVANAIPMKPAQGTRDFNYTPDPETAYSKSTKALLGYNVYRALNSGAPALLDFTELTTYTDNVGVTGVYTYCVTAVYDDGESECSNDHVVDVITGIDQHLVSSTKLFPNPASDAVNIESDFTIKSVQVYNFAGQIVLSEKTNSTIYRINTSNLDAGIYLFQVETENGSIAKRIVIE